MKHAIIYLTDDAPPIEVPWENVVLEDSHVLLKREVTLRIIPWHRVRFITVTA